MEERVVWQSCSVNCGTHCPLRFHVQNGRLLYVETDNRPTVDGEAGSGAGGSGAAAGASAGATATGPAAVAGAGRPAAGQSGTESPASRSNTTATAPETRPNASTTSHNALRCPQLRACVKGRSMRYWLSSAERLDYPMRRTGRRGEGAFERISWEEALDEITSQIQRIVHDYGNESVYLPYGTGLFPASGSPFERLMNSYGGHLGRYGDYSCAQLQTAIAYTYGDDGYYSGSTLSETRNADLVVLFGSNPAGTRMGGGAPGWEFRQAREQGDFKLICIDPRYTETLCGSNDEWIPLRPGTDAALVGGIAHVLITENLVDQEFLGHYCIGYDQSTLPDDAPANASYRDYILGTGPDGTAKTPEWASRITGVPASRIVSLAREMAGSRALFVAQGWGPQRHQNGELTARAIPMLAILTGNVGLPGTNTGARERFLPFTVAPDPVGDNPVATKIPVFMWSRAVENGCAMTAQNAGVTGAPRLGTGVKMIIAHASNCLTNQHADINRTHDILADETLCEFIIVCDVVMTDSARYADILLPDIARAEQRNAVSTGNADMVRGVLRGDDWGAAVYERRRAVDIAREIARRLGVLEAFDAIGGADDARSEFAGGVECAPYDGQTVGLAAFRQDPVGNPLPTPSGKIEIYSQRLALLASTLEYPDGFVVDPLPIYAPEPEGCQSALRDTFSYQLIGFHCAGHVHSSYANVPELNALFPHELWVNPLDAKQLGIDSGTLTKVSSARGSIVVSARVTPRIMPGVVALPQGAWHEADMDGNRIDVGACINTLTSDVPTPLSRGNAQHTILVRIEPIDISEARALDNHCATRPGALPFGCLGMRQKRAARCSDDGCQGGDLRRADDPYQGGDQRQGGGQRQGDDQSRGSNLHQEAIR